MGVIYKFKPEIKDYILQQKKEKAQISCRGLIALIEESFRIKVSKSSIHLILQKAGLSMPVGRRPKRSKKKSGVANKLIILAEQTKAISLAPVPVAKTELPLKREPGAAILLKAVDCLFGNKLSLEDIISYLNDRQKVIINAPSFEVIQELKREIKLVKISFSDQSILYLDGQMHRFWPTATVPDVFSITLYSAKSYIDRIIHKDEPLVLFMAPGDNALSGEFFHFMLSPEAREKRIVQFGLCENELKELESIPLSQEKKCFFLFGLWPWQFIEYRKLKKIGAFSRQQFSPLQKEFYLAPAEIELLQPDAGQSVTLRGCALKASPSEKIRLVILSNLSAEIMKIEEMASVYLSRWPNLEETFYDYTRKVELFTYTGNSGCFLAGEKLAYVEFLGLYLKRYFSPAGTDFPTTKAHFYDLKVSIEKQKDYLLAAFLAPANYPRLKDLEYACRRLNERDIRLEDGTRLWLLV